MRGGKRKLYGLYNCVSTVHTILTHCHVGESQETRNSAIFLWYFSHRLIYTLMLQIFFLSSAGKIHALKSLHEAKHILNCVILQYVNCQKAQNSHPTSSSSGSLSTVQTNHNKSDPNLIIFALFSQQKDVEALLYYQHCRCKEALLFLEALSEASLS